MAAAQAAGKIAHNVTGVIGEIVTS